jgi:hypothetical protein
MGNADQRAEHADHGKYIPPVGQPSGQCKRWMRRVRHVPGWICGWDGWQASDVALFLASVGGVSPPAAAESRPDGMALE